MIRAILLPSVLLLSACGTKSTPPVVFPDIPPLPPSIASPCPPAALLSGSSLGTLVLADIDLAVAYAECSARHAATVAAYDKVRAEIAAKATAP